MTVQNSSYRVPQGLSIYGGKSAPPTPSIVLTSLASSTTSGVSKSALVIANNGTSAANWSLSAAPAGLTITPSSGSLSGRGSQLITLSGVSTNSYTITLSSSNATITGSPKTFAITAGLPTTATLSGSISGNANVAVTYTVTLNNPADQNYTITPSCAGATVAPSTFTILTGQSSGQFTVTATSGGYSVDFAVSPTLTRAGRPINLTITNTSPTTATLSGPSVATTGIAVTHRITVNLPADQTYTFTIARSNSGTGVSSAQITAGQTFVDFTSTWPTSGSGYTVSVTGVVPSLTISGSPITLSVASYTWQFADLATLNTGINTITNLAVGLQGTEDVYAYPDLLPGQTLSNSGGSLNLVGDATVPTVGSTVGGTPKDIIANQSQRTDNGWRIEVMDSPIAQWNVIRSGSIIGTYGKNVGAGTTWYNCMRDIVQDGDTVEITPGAINATEADCTGYFNGLDNAGMAIFRGVTIRNMAGRGRWRLFPLGTVVGASRSGITIYSPTDLKDEPGNPRKSFTVQGFDLTDQIGANRDAYGFRVRQGAPDGITWNYTHVQVNVKDFKIGMTFGTCGSGFNNGAEVMVIEDGHVFDCGWSGYEHNFYVTSHYLTIKGVRSSRSRTPLDGHIFKTRSANTTIQGCVFEGLTGSDNTDVIQIANGGNAIITGNLLVQGPTPSANNGIIVYENEQAGNVPWFYGLEGHSLIVRQNVMISRAGLQFGWGCPLVTLRPSNSAAYIMPSTLTVSDNIGTNVNLATTYWIAQTINNTSGFTALADWTVGNTVGTYDASDSIFSDTALKLYSRTAGTIAGSGTLATNRFLWPHGYMARNDNFRGLG